jgi:hypothetical protein
VNTYEQELEKQEKKLKAQLKIQEQILDTLSSPGWKQIKKWLESAIKSYALLPRMKTVTEEILNPGTGKPIKIKRQPTLEEIAVWNIKMESYKRGMLFIYTTLLPKRQESQKKGLEDELKKLQNQTEEEE